MKKLMKQIQARWISIRRAVRWFVRTVLLLVTAFGVAVPGVTTAGNGSPSPATKSGTPSEPPDAGQAGSIPRSGQLDLRQAVRIAVDRHPSISDAVATLTQQQSGIDSARAGYYPKVGVGINGGTSGRNLNSLSSNSTLATGTISQMLYDFGKVGGRVDQAQAMTRRQQATILRQIDIVAQDTANAVVAAHRYQSILVSAKDYLRATERVLEMARLRSNSGVSTKADPIQALSRVDGARAYHLQYEAALRQSNERLRTLVGSPPTAQGVAPLPDAMMQGIRENQQPDYRILPDVMVAEADRQAAQAIVGQARAERWPTISLDASINKALRGNNPNTFEPHGTYQNIGINLTAPLYQGGGLEAQVRGAIAADEAAQMRIKNARLNADDQVRSYREQVDGARARLGVLAQRKRSIVEARDLYQEQYKLGTRSILDLLNAEQEIYMAAVDEENVRHDLWQGLISYVYAVGQSRAFYGLDNTTVQGIAISPVVPDSSMSAQDDAKTDGKYLGGAAVQSIGVTPPNDAKIQEKNLGPVVPPAGANKGRDGAKAQEKEKGFGNAVRSLPAGEPSDAKPQEKDFGSAVASIAKPQAGAKPEEKEKGFGSAVRSLPASAPVATRNQEKDLVPAVSGGAVKAVDNTRAIERKAPVPATAPVSVPVSAAAAADNGKIEKMSLSVVQDSAGGPPQQSAVQEPARKPALQGGWCAIRRPGRPNASPNGSAATPPPGQVSAAD